MNWLIDFLYRCQNKKELNEENMKKAEGKLSEAGLSLPDL